MTPKTLKGWIFDVYPVAEGMCLWFIETSGTKHRLIDQFSPSFYIGGPPLALKKALTFISRFKIPLQIKATERIEFYSGQHIPVVQITTANPLHFPKVVQWIITFEYQKKDRATTLSLYNCDLSLPQHYFFFKKCFPLAFCQITLKNERDILKIDIQDSPWATDYTIPPLSIMKLRMEGQPMNPEQRESGRLEIEVNGRCHTLEGENEVDIVKQFNRNLQRYDPDLILSEWGDPYLLPKLIETAARFKISLHLNREHGKKVQFKKERSYFSYGQIIHKAAARTLLGRWHIDSRNSFLYGQTGLEGIFEFARLSKIPVQETARTSTGTGITSMQMDLAFQEGILIPWRKRVPEAFKSAKQLLLTDKGGLTYAPKPAFHEAVGEIDFASMYPSIMAKYNISPETINCTCCSNNRVPEIGYHLCQKRIGLIPKFLQPFLKKREKYKQLKKAETDPIKKAQYDQRQSALKWGLVTTFGYQGAGSK